MFSMGSICLCIGKLQGLKQVFLIFNLLLSNLIVFLIDPQVVQWDSTSCCAGSTETGGNCRSSPGRGPLPRAALLLPHGGHTAACWPWASGPICILFLRPQEQGQGSQKPVAPRKREGPKGEPARPEQSLCHVAER